MRKAIFAVLALLGIALGSTALAPIANATYLPQPNQNEGNNN